MSGGSTRKVDAAELAAALVEGALDEEVLGAVLSSTTLRAERRRLLAEIRFLRLFAVYELASVLLPDEDDRLRFHRLLDARLDTLRDEDAPASEGLAGFGERLKAYREALGRPTGRSPAFAIGLVFARGCGLPEDDDALMRGATLYVNCQAAMTDALPGHVRIEFK